MKNSGKIQTFEAEKSMKERRMNIAFKKRFTIAHSAVKRMTGSGQGTNQIPVPRRKTMLES